MLQAFNGSHSHKLSIFNFNEINLIDLENTYESISPDIILIDIGKSHRSIEEFVHLLMICSDFVNENLYLLSDSKLKIFEKFIGTTTAKNSPFKLIKKHVDSIKRLEMKYPSHRKTKNPSKEEKFKNLNSIPIPIRGELDLKIRFKDIVHLESYGNMTYIYVDKMYMDKFKIVAYKNLGQLTAELPVKYFRRVHKSYTINKSKVIRVSNAGVPQIEMKNNYKVPVARRKYKDFQQWIMKK